jgi:hypothetical protein
MLHDRFNETTILEQMIANVTLQIQFNSPSPAAATIVLIVLLNFAATAEIHHQYPVRELTHLMKASCQQR